MGQAVQTDYRVGELILLSWYFPQKRLEGPQKVEPGVTFLAPATC